MKISRIKNLIAAPESAFHIELTNDSSLVNCDYEGNPVEGAAYETSTILLYYGAKDAWNDFNVSIQTSGITASLDRNTHVITPSNIRYDKAVITVTAAHKTRSGLVLTATYTLAKNKPGQPGEKAVSYSLIPSLHVIRKDSNGTLLDKQISFVVHKRVGSDLTVISTYKQLFENVLDIKIGDDDNGNYIGDSSKGDKEIVADTADFWKGNDAVLVRLEHEVNTDLCYDSESIGVVMNGEDAVSYYITSTVPSIRANENGVPFNPGQSIVVSEWKRIGKNPSAKSADLKMTIYQIKGSEKQYFGQQNWAPEAHFEAEMASGCDSLQAELTDSSGNVVFSLPIPVEWQGKTGADGVTYEIIPSVANIRADNDGNVLTGVIQVLAYKTKGETRTSCSVGAQVAIGIDGQSLPHYWVQYKIDFNAWTNCANISIGTGLYTLMGYGVPASAVSTIKTGIAFRLLYGTSSSSAVVHEIAALQVVRDGQKGEQGKTGRFYYYDGYFDNTKEYTATDHQAPYVAFDWQDKQTVNGTEIDVIRTSYYMLVTETNKQGNSYIAPRTTAATGVWEQMETSFKFLIAQAFFTDFGKLGSAVFSGDWMISQYGTPGILFINDEKNVLNTIVNTRKASLETLASLKNANGSYKTTNATYTTLKNYYAEAKLQKAIDQAVWAVENEATLEQLLAMSTTSYQLFGVDPDNPFKLFAPNIALDFLIGKAYLHDADIQGTVNALNGTFKGAVYALEGKFTGEIESQAGYIGGFNITETSLTSRAGSLNILPNGVEFRPTNGSVAWLGATDNVIAAFYSKMGKNYIFACGAQFGAEGASKLNAAIDITKGVVSGYVPVVTQVSSNITIVCDNNVVNDTANILHVRSGGVFLPFGNSNLTITLPLSPANGTKYTIIKTNQANTVVSCQGTNKIAVNQRFQDAGSTYTLSAYARLELVYYGGYWYGNT